MVSKLEIKYKLFVNIQYFEFNVNLRSDETVDVKEKL